MVWAAEDTTEALRPQYRGEAVDAVHLRLNELWRLCLGEGPTTVASVVDVDRGAVQRWLRWYRAGGRPKCRLPDIQKPFDWQALESLGKV